MLSVATTPAVDDQVVVHVDGELDLDTAPGLVERLEQLADGGNALVVLDLAGLSFCDSSGMQAFVRLHEHGQRTGFQVLLRNINPNVQRVLDVSGVGDIVNIDR
jgi:anti-anti-sigma factor